MNDGLAPPKTASKLRVSESQSGSREGGTPKSPLRGSSPPKKGKKGVKSKKVTNKKNKK